MRLAIKTFIFLLFILFGMTRTSYAVTIELTIEDIAGVDRVDEYVSYGVPLASIDNATSTSTFKITDSGDSSVDAQFRVLSRYNGTPGDGTKNIRMVLCTFLVSVGANASATYYLNTSGGSGTVSGSDIASSDANKVTLNNGTVTAEIKKTAGFNLFDKVTIGGTDYISSPASDGIILREGRNDTTYTSYSSNDAPTVTIEENGPLKAVVSVEGNLEDSGNNPVYPTNGTYTGDTPIRYATRITTYKNERLLRVLVTIKNENRPYSYTGTAGDGPYPQIHNLELDYLFIRTTFSNITAETVSFGSGVDGESSWKKTATPSATYVLLQSHTAPGSDSSTRNDFSNFSYTVKEGVTTRASGGRYNSFANVRDSSNGIMVASRWFWQNWKKEIQFDTSNNRIDFYLWPDDSSDHIFMGGKYKTHEILYCFHAAVASDYNFATELAPLKNRLYIVPSNLHTSNFFDSIPPDLESFDPEVTWINDGKTEYLRTPIYQWNQKTRAKFDASYIYDSSDTNDFDNLRENRPFTWSGGIYNGNYINWYGWLAFGGLVRYNSLGFASQHYNWDYIALISGLRYSDPYIIDLGEQFAYNHGDILTMHDPDASPTEAISTNGTFDELDAHGSQVYENDGHFHMDSFQGYSGGSNSDPRGYAHQWATGLMFQYLLTGNEHFKDVIDDVGENIFYRYSDIEVNGHKQGSHDSTAVCYDPDGSVEQCWGGESRQYTRAIDVAVGMWKVTGDSDFLEVANAIFEKAVLINEVSISGQPKGILSYGTTRAWCCNLACDAHLFYEAISLKPLILLYYALYDNGDTTEATAVYDYLVRHANWAVDELYTNWDTADCGTYSGSTYFPYTVKLDWRRSCEYSGSGNIDSAYSSNHADLFAFLYEETGTQSWLDLARMVFKDKTLYSANGSYIAINETTYEQIEISAFQPTPGSAWLKEGKVLEKPMFYLMTEYNSSETQSQISGITATGVTIQ